MADIFRQMQKKYCHYGAPNGGKRQWARRRARRDVKRISDDLITCRKS